MVLKAFIVALLVTAIHAQPEATPQPITDATDAPIVITDAPEPETPEATTTTAAPPPPPSPIVPIDPFGCPPNALMDLIFVVDSSSSVGPENFQLIRDFLADIVRKFNIGIDSVQTGLVRYNRDVDDRWNLNSFTSMAEVLAAIDEIPYRGRGTMTGQAIAFTAETKFSEAMGRRPGVPAVALVITDGRSRDDVVIPSLALHEVATVIALGIGGAVQEELDMIATAHPRNSFSQIVDDFSELASVIDVLVDNFCEAEREAPVAPAPGLCEGAIDLGFVLDSSSSIGDDSFQLVRDFTAEVVNGFEIASNLTRVSISRYTTWTDSILFYQQEFDKDAILQTIADIPYYGRGTRTADALKTFANHHQQEYNGWRPDKSHVVIVVTDGDSQDRDEIDKYARRLRARSTRVIAIGVGDYEGLESELVEIATAPASENVILISDYSELADYVIDIINRACETVGNDNECLVNNGDCDETCVDTYESFYCECFESGYSLQPDGSCLDDDECAVDDGGCSDICNNSPGSYSCACFPGRIMSGDGRTCVDDSCFGNTDCGQVCNNVLNGAFYCSCFPGYTLNEDRRTCSDIDECESANICEHGCNNTAGGFLCTCPEGFGLRADGRTCGRQCFSCNRALSNEECQDVIVCSPNELSCQTETRLENGQLYISKQCKQTEACANNFIQNPRTAWSPTQCNDNPEGASVCRCCCHDNLCNAVGDCSLADDIDISCEDPYELFGGDLAPGQNLTCTGTEIGDSCTLSCPDGYQVSGELMCTQKPRTTEGEWIGQVGECVDIDECAVNNGGCSDICTNTNGSFVCSCPEENLCETQPLDLFFILDSSSSVGQENFDMMLGFVARTTDFVTIGQDNTRVGVMTYNRDATKRFDFIDVTDAEDLNTRLGEIEYSGRGTLTAGAIDSAVQNCFTEERGRRPDVPLSVVLITDGRSKDHRRLESAVEALHNAATEVIAIGVGSRVNEDELLQIANGDPSQYRMVADFTALDDTLLNDLNNVLCTQPEQAQTLTSDLRNCDFDECSVGNGGCSHYCNNTVGSYYCSCPEGMSIVADRVTCDVDECLVDMGGCEQGCVNKLGSFSCLCGPLDVVADGFGCDDYNECLDANGGCSDICEDFVGGYRCLCPEGLILVDEDMCVEDPCFSQVPPFQCDQICLSAGDGYVCSCEQGYTLDADQHNCTEIDECANNNGGCEQTCVNTEGSYRCECPEGYQIRDDGRSCGIVCYHCDNVLSNEECGETKACAVSQDSCFTTMRTRNNVTRITKGCQQTLACINNLIQNPRDHGEGPSQCNVNSVNSKCECCCTGSFCNAELCPYDFSLPGCPSFEKEFVTFRGLQNNGDVFPGGVASVSCDPGFQYSQLGAAPTQINCNYNFQNATAEWDGSPDDLDICEDIDECEQFGGGCVDPAICVNLPGSFECQCPEVPDDYELIDGVICERDECADPDQGGCSHNCTNTVGGYMCFCPGDLSLVDDGLTCDPNECREGNAGCAEICVNTLGGFECDCHEGSFLTEDGFTCQDIDECLTDNGGCSHNCENLSPGWECSCPEGMILNADGFICRPDPCFVNNGGCAQICAEAEEGVVTCSCRSGFVTTEDGGCLDIDECAQNNGGCQYNCTNFDGGYTCECPVGQSLAADLKTCGVACYSCEGAKTNEECNANRPVVCPTDANACENQVRVHKGEKLIFKRCKQDKSCSNNFLQNPRTAWMPTQCNGEEANDVCRCCCQGHLCNVNEKPCETEQECRLTPADVLLILDSSSSVKFDNFQKVKAFSKALLTTFDLGEGRVHTAAIRYNKDVDEQFNFAYSNDRMDVEDAIDNIPYDGRGTMTGKAITYAREMILKESNGARPGVPKIVIVVTDGRSKDDVAIPSAALRDDGAIIFAVGIGNVDENELMMIADSGDQIFIAEDFDALSGLVLMEIQDSVCLDNNECAVENGGCSHVCIDTQGSYFCECPEPLFLGADSRTCQEFAPIGIQRSASDECANNNGGCSDFCTDTLVGYNCSCEAGKVLGPDEHTCFDINECDVDNGACSDGCVNTAGGYFCECPEDHIISEDLHTCVPREGVADCPAGYLALGHSCMRRTAESGTYAEAEADCASDGGRLVKVGDMGIRILIYRNFGKDGLWAGLTDRDEEGVWVNSDGTVFEYENGWGQDQPGFGDCGQIKEYLSSQRCEASAAGVCEIPRLNGFVVFSRTWPNGAQGKLYFPTDVNAVRVRFPQAVKDTNVWFSTLARQESSRSYIITQNDIERQSSTGQGEFTLEMRNARFPDYNVVVEPFIDVDA
ncbi:unnamed protein product [Clavelina lepadiformis]|uniref:Uncharacterized protein n=1 Tax=Clavelina lepadiformis TaxID=159417 RepID=A0ABP0F0L8_CLALP